MDQCAKEERTRLKGVDILPSYRPIQVLGVPLQSPLTGIFFGTQTGVQSAGQTLQTPPTPSYSLLITFELTRKCKFGSRYFPFRFHDFLVCRPQI